MNIAILGAGNIGGSIGKKWAAAGHTVRFGVRNPNKPDVQSLVRSLGTNASVASVGEAIDFAVVVLFAIPGHAMDQTVASNARALDGKILIDAANNVSAPIPNNLATFTAYTPKAKVYRAFNIYGWENFENPTIDGVPGDLFYCGPDGESRSVMDNLITDVGLRPVWVGGLDQIELIDNLLRLWLTLAYGQQTGRRLAFKAMTP